MKLCLFYSQLFIIFSFSVNAQPEITFETKLLNVDTIDFKSQREFIFKFKNTGNEPLIISQVQTSGGPLVWNRYKMIKNTFLPGESGEIYFHYDTERIGTIYKNATVLSNAKTDSDVLTVKGYIRKIPIVYAQKTEHDFGSISARTKLHYEFEVRNIGLLPLTISSLKQSRNCTAYFLNNTIEAGQYSVLFMEVDTRNAKNMVEAHCTVFSSDVKSPMLFSLKADLSYSPLKIDSAYFYRNIRKDYFIIQLENTSTDTLEITRVNFIATKDNQPEISFQILDSDFLINPLSKKEVLIKANFPSSFIYGFEKKISVQTENIKNNKRYWNIMYFKF